ncbi:hypothetical protein [Alkaliphilus crotonatoxidans]
MEEKKAFNYIIAVERPLQSAFSAILNNLSVINQGNKDIAR